MGGLHRHDAVHLCGTAGDVDARRSLLKGGADPKIETFRGTNALMAAAGVNWVFNQTYWEGEKRNLEAVNLCFGSRPDRRRTSRTRWA
jgi:hypothetical protein